MFSKLATKVKEIKHQIILMSKIQLKAPSFSVPSFPTIAHKLRSSAAGLKPSRPIDFSKIRVKAPFLASAARASTFLRFAGSFLKKNSKKIYGATAIASLAAYSGYHYYPSKTKISLHYQNTPENEDLVKHLTFLNDSHFYPSFYLTHSLAQSVYNIKTPKLDLKYHREYIRLPDGGQVCLDWALPLRRVGSFGKTPHSNQYYPYEPASDSKVMFIIHGLTGGSETQYIQHLVKDAQKKGYRVAVFNSRGINQPMLTPTPSHGGSLEDIEFAIESVRQKYPAAPLVAVGTSMGGNQLIRYLGEKGKESPFAVAAAISAPFSIETCAEAVEGTVYEKFFVQKYVEKTVVPHLDILQRLQESHGVNLQTLLSTKSLREFHTNFSLKVFDQHKTLDEYFGTTNITDQHIKNVSIPLLCLQSKDDPIVVSHGIPVNTLKTNSNIIYAETSHGAHICWFSGIVPKRWYPKPTLQYLDYKLYQMGLTKDNNKASF
jgi:predicted alpha/beta-fold hydrolase